MLFLGIEAVVVVVFSISDQIRKQANLEAGSTSIRKSITTKFC